MNYDDRSQRMRGAFPAALSADVSKVLELVPPVRLHASATDVGPVVVGGERLFIPSRVYSPEPADMASLLLSETQRKVLSCIYTRHHAGFVRQRYVEPLLSFSKPWVAPFIFALVGEYVVEIIQVIDQGATTLLRDNLVRFADANPEFCALTRQRAISYWNCYYRTQFPLLTDYPACAFLLSLGLWPRNKTRRPAG